MKSARREENVLCGIAKILDSRLLRHRAHFYRNLSHIELVINKKEEKSAAKETVKRRIKRERQE